MHLGVSRMPQRYRHVPKRPTPVLSLCSATHRLRGNSEPDGRQMAGMTKNWAGEVALSHATLHDSRILKPELISATAWRRKGRRERRRCVPRKCTVWTRAGAARLDGLQPSQKNVRRKIPPNGHTRLKFGFSYEISQHNDFRYFRHQFHSTFPRHSTKPMFRSFPMTPLMR